MTIHQARILAIFMSLAYIPAFIFGVVSVWTPFMAAATAWLFRVQLQGILIQSEGIEDLEQKSRFCSQQSFFTIFESSLGISLGFVLGVCFLKAFALNGVLFDEFIFKKLMVWIDSSQDYQNLNLSNKIILHTFVAGLITFVFLYLFANSYTKKIMYVIMYKCREDSNYSIKNYNRYRYWNSDIGLFYFPLLYLLVYYVCYEILNTNLFLGAYLTILCVFLVSLFNTCVFYFLRYGIAAMDRASQIAGTFQKINGK